VSLARARRGADARPDAFWFFRFSASQRTASPTHSAKRSICISANADPTLGCGHMSSSYLGVTCSAKPSSPGVSSRDCQEHAESHPADPRSVSNLVLDRHTNTRLVILSCSGRRLGKRVIRTAEEHTPPPAADDAYASTPSSSGSVALSAIDPARAAPAHALTSCQCPATKSSPDRGPAPDHILVSELEPASGRELLGDASSLAHGSSAVHQSRVDASSVAMASARK